MGAVPHIETVRVGGLGLSGVWSGYRALDRVEKGVRHTMTYGLSLTNLVKGVPYVQAQIQGSPCALVSRPVQPCIVLGLLALV